ncbi:hypothetical protein BJX99DRAFT_251139 [Aspergillus californicus]
MALQIICIVFSPYHVGLHDHRVGNGRSRIDRVNDFEGEIGRSFEILRRISTTVSTAVAENTFPLILSGNCMASAAVACGLRAQSVEKRGGGGDDALVFIYFDAHDDLDSPDVNENGYLDAMGLLMLRGESWKTLMGTVPGFEAFDFGNGRFLYCGLRDQSAVQRQRVVDSGMHSIWGGINREGEKKVDFVAGLKRRLQGQSYGPALVHLDLDVLDESYGKVNNYLSPGGLFEDVLVPCIDSVLRMVTPKSLTVCSFDPDAGDGDKVAGIALRAIIAFVRSLLETGVISKP